MYSKLSVVILMAALVVGCGAKPSHIKAQADAVAQINKQPVLESTVIGFGSLKYYGPKQKFQYRDPNETTQRTIVSIVKTAAAVVLGLEFFDYLGGQTAAMVEIANNTPTIVRPEVVSPEVIDPVIIETPVPEVIQVPIEGVD
jgi:hypothetical protein